MPLYIAKSGDLDRCYRCLTHWLTTLKDRATQLLIKYKSGALVTQFVWVTPMPHSLTDRQRKKVLLKILRNRSGAPVTQRKKKKLTLSGMSSPQLNGSWISLFWQNLIVATEYWLKEVYIAQCADWVVSFPSKLRHILKFVSWYIIQQIFVPACSVGRKTWFSRKPWFSNSKFGISGSFWPILSVPKIMLLVPENEKQYKF